MKNLFQLSVEKLPSIRWKVSELVSKSIYTRAFKGFGTGSVLVNPLKLKGLDLIEIGDQVAIYEGAWLQAEAGSQLTIGSGTYVGHHVHIHAVSNLSIGENCILADNVLINNSEHVKGEIQKISSRGPIMIGNRVFVGQNAVILANVTIGDDAIIGAGSVVTKDVPSGVTVAGVPAKPVIKNNHSEN